LWVRNAVDSAFGVAVQKDARGEPNPVATAAAACSFSCY
jgi:hypothetical protein